MHPSENIFDHLLDLPPSAPPTVKIPPFMQNRGVTNNKRLPDILQSDPNAPPTILDYFLKGQTMRNTSLPGIHMSQVEAHARDVHPADVLAFLVAVLRRVSVDLVPSTPSFTALTPPTLAPTPLTPTPPTPPTLTPTTLTPTTLTPTTLTPPTLTPTTLTPTTLTPTTPSPTTLISYYSHTYYSHTCYSS